jgi:hypothetical protein
MNLDLTDDETVVLLRELDNIIEGDRFPLSPRILTLKAIRAKLRPEPTASHCQRRSIMSRHVWAEGDGGRAASAIRCRQGEDRREAFNRRGRRANGKFFHKGLEL